MAPKGAKDANANAKTNYAIYGLDATYDDIQQLTLGTLGCKVTSSHCALCLS